MSRLSHNPCRDQTDGLTPYHSLIGEKPRPGRMETLLPHPFRHVEPAADCKYDWANKHLNLADEMLARRENKGDVMHAFTIEDRCK